MDFIVDATLRTNKPPFQLSSYVRANDAEHAKAIMLKAMADDGRRVLRLVANAIDEIPCDCAYIDETGFRKPWADDERVEK